MERGVLIGYHLQTLECAVIGPYNKVCGGCDAVKTQEEICQRVRLFNSTYGKVILEGSLVGHTFQRYSDLAHELGDYTFMFLNTPLKRCIQRVEDRRAARGNTKPFDPKNVIKDWHCTQNKLPQKFEEAGHQVVIVQWERSVEVVTELIKGGYAVHLRQ
jgi:hypothetical protein